MEDGNILRTLQYSISPEEYQKAFVFYQKKYVYPKNWIFTAIFGTLAVFFIQQLSVDPRYTQGWVLLAIAVGFMPLNWLNTFHLRKNVFQAVMETQNDSYTASFTEEGITIQTTFPEGVEAEPVAPKVISYSMDVVDILEIQDVFILYIRRKIFYVIPKRPLSEEEYAFLTEHFQDRGMGRFKRFLDK